jgi:hypothetical protein
MSDDSKMSIWSVGPSILLSAGIYGAAAGVATYLWPDVLLIPTAPYLVFLVAGLILLVAGIVMLMFAGRAIVGAHGEDKLATTGIFGVVRNPIYSAWIVFIAVMKPRPLGVVMSKGSAFLGPEKVYS